jgi:hypothetical protein
MIGFMLKTVGKHPRGFAPWLRIYAYTLAPPMPGEGRHAEIRGRVFAKDAFALALASPWVSVRGIHTRCAVRPSANMIASRRATAMRVAHENENVRGVHHILGKYYRRASLRGNASDELVWVCEADGVDRPRDRQLVSGVVRACHGTEATVFWTDVEQLEDHSQQLAFARAGDRSALELVLWAAVNPTAGDSCAIRVSPQGLDAAAQNGKSVASDQRERLNASHTDR